MKSKEPSEMLDLEAVIPTSAADIEALRRIRQTPEKDALADIDSLRTDRLGGFRPGRKTSAGWEPFTL